MKAEASKQNLFKALYTKLSKKLIRAHRSSIEPVLSEDKKYQKLKFCLDAWSEHDKAQYKNMYNTLMIDEKEFDITTQRS